MWFDRNFDGKDGDFGKFEQFYGYEIPEFLGKQVF
jgi:hypothetical protein